MDQAIAKRAAGAGVVCHIGGNDGGRAVVVEHIVLPQRIAHANTAIFTGREFQRGRDRNVTRLELKAVLVVGHGIARRKPEPYIAAQERGFGKHDFRVRVVRRRPDLKAQELTTAKEVALGETGGQTGTVGDRIGQTEGQRSGRLLFHIHIDDHVAGGAALAGLDTDVAKEAKRADALGGLADLSRVERVALDRVELTTDHAVQRGRVALDVDTFDKDTFTTRHNEFDVQGQIAVVAGHARVNTDEIHALLHGQTFQTGKVVFHDGRRIGLAGFDVQGVQIDIGVDLRQIAADRDLTECELLTFLDVKGDQERIAAAGQFRGDRQDLKIDIAPRHVKIAQDLFVEFNTVGDERVGAHNAAQQTRLFGFQNAAQAALGIGAVADERQALNLDHVALDDLKHQIDTVVRAADDLGRDRCGQTALLLIGLHKGGGILFGQGRAVDAARLGLHDRGKDIVPDPAVALKVDDVDGRVFLDLDHQCVTARRDQHILEQTRVDDVLIGLVQGGGRDRFAAVDSGIGQDGGAIDPLVAGNFNLGKAIALRVCLCRQNSKSH